MSIKYDFLDKTDKSVRDFFANAYEVNPEDRNDDTLKKLATDLFATVSFPEGNREDVASISVTAPWSEEPLVVNVAELTAES